MPFRSAAASSSFFAVVVMLMFRPRRCVDLVVLDFGENDLLFHTDVVVAATAIKRTTGHYHGSHAHAGRDTVTKRSRNSNMLLATQVTIAPIG